MTRLPFFKIFILFIFFGILLSCKDDEFHFNNVTTYNAAYKSLIDKHQKDIDRIINEINSINEVHSFIGDTLSSFDIIKNDPSEFSKMERFLLDNSSFLDEKFKIQFSDILIISNKKSFNNNPKFCFGDSLKTDFQLAYFEPTLRRASNIKMESKFTFWSYVNRKVTKKKISSLDSVTQNRVKEIKKYFETDFKRLIKTKYLLAYQDKFFIEPKLVNDSIFEPGVLCSKLKLYDLKTKIKIAEKLILVTNNDKITTLKNFLDDMDRKMLILDLLKQRESMTVEFLKVK